MNIVVLDGGILNPGDISWGPLQSLGELTVYDETDSSDLPERAAGADVVLVNKTPIDKNTINYLKDCKLIGVLATGTNNLDMESLTSAGIQVCNVPGYGVEDVAQHSLALILELARNIGSHSRSVKAGDWQASGKWCYWLKPPLSLKGLTLGIIGFGSIGQTLGKYANSLGMNILANARRHNAKVDYPFRYAELEEIWKNADFISLHCPLTPETDKIINAKSIAAMKPGAMIINTARGGLVDEQAAAEALKCGKLGGLGTDVLNSEPPSADNPLLNSPNTLITPHIAWATRNAREKIIEMTRENILAFYAGKPIHAVNIPLPQKHTI